MLDVKHLNFLDRSAMMRSSLCRCVILGFVGVLGVVLTTAGIAILLGFSSLLETLVKQNVVLAEGNQVYDYWKHPPIPIYLKVYFFNITNKEEFPWDVVKPRIQEVGPYVYREDWRKVDIRWNPNDTVSYRQVRTFAFEPSLSAGTEDDVIHTLNIPMLTAAYMFKTAGPLVKLALTSVFHMLHESIVIEKQVRELAFEGYNDPLTKAAREIFRTYPFTRFGYFYGKNGSDDGEYNVYTGADDSKKFTLIDRWNGEEMLPWWSSSYCNMINGTDGSSFHPLLEQDERIDIFSTDLCRSVSLIYDKTIDIDDIPAYRYTPVKQMLDNGTREPGNQCYCVGSCLPSGVYNISHCKFGAPLFISYPHFYEADPVYLNAIDGLRPNQSEHQMFADLEPITGMVVKVAAKFQINAYLEEIPNFTFFEHVKTTMFPLLWFSEEAEVDTAMKDVILSSTQKPYFYSRVVAFSVLALGFLLLTFTAIYAVILNKHNRKITKELNEKPT